MYEYGGRNTKTFAKLPGFKNVVAWQQASDLGTLIVQATSHFGPGWWKLADQMRSAAWSIGANIAEGYGRSNLNDYLRFCEIARGSAHELGSYLQDCERANLIPAELLAAHITRYSQTTWMLDKLIQGIQKRRNDGGWNRSFSAKEPRTNYAIESATDWSTWGAANGPDDFLELP